MQRSKPVIRRTLQVSCCFAKVNWMVEQLNATFHALADPTRRAMLVRLARGEQSVAALAPPWTSRDGMVLNLRQVGSTSSSLRRGRFAPRREHVMAAA